MESAVNSIIGFFTDTTPKELIVFLISLLPVLECRGGMLAAKLLGVKLWKAFIICYAGNIVPIPFILLFVRKIFRFLGRFERTKKLVDKIVRRSLKKGNNVVRYKGWGLLLFVSIPLPGTGGWTGAVLADILDLRFKYSLPIIAVGVLIADLIMTALSYGLLGLVI